MIVLDANILLYAWNESAPNHARAKSYVEGLFSNEEWVGLTWATIWAFIRISTNPRLSVTALDGKRAFEIVGLWTALPNVAIINPGPRHSELLKKLVVGSQATGPLVSDAALAALAIENGAVLASTDRDFSRFAGLSWINPLSDME